MNYFNQDADEAVSRLGSDKTKGLTDAQVLESRRKSGENAIAEEKQKSLITVFLEQFADLLVAILIAASVVSIISGEIGSTIVILVVLVMNAIIGTVQHVKAQKSLNSLKAMSSPNARVVRNGVQAEIPASEVVVGDILLIEAGNVASADGRILEAASLQVNESALTGESLNVTKSAERIDKDELPLGDRLNMIYSGSNIANGRAAAVVTAVGMNTEIGKIASLMQNAKKKKTPLQVSLDKFSKILSIAVIAICIMVFLMTYFINGQSAVDAMMFAVALAVAAIPEALSSIITISLAIGTQKMSKQKAIIKDLKAVEGLGCVSVICSDKTGTLTQNKMTVRDINSPGEAAMSDLLLAMALCNDAANKASAENESKRACGCERESVQPPAGWLGDPTETALAEYLGAENYVRIREENPRLDEIPFDSDRKLMTTVHNIGGERTAFTKGAVDVLIPRLKFILDGDNIRPTTEKDFENIRRVNLAYSENGMRVLAFAKKVLKNNAAVTLEDECDYIYIGLAAMTDPPREESKTAVAECISAGIKPVMITGDHKLTAVAIAKEIGIYKDGDIAMDGTELDNISDEELSAKLEKISVYARVSPVHKIRIVGLWQAKDMVVAMTGDGVNDAPALKKADVGVAMGITGTEVSKDAASMILADDNFATIVKAVANGRCIYGNIKNAIKFLLAGNAAAILVVLLTTVLNLPLPFSPVHLLFINLLTDSLPALALCMEPMQPGLMNQKPRSSKESILNKETGIYIVFHSVIIATCVMAAFLVGKSGCDSAAMASTMAFGTLCLARLFEGFDSRGEYSLAKLGVTGNMFSVGAFLAGALFLVCALMIAPLQGIMNVSNAFTAVNLLQVAGFAVIPFALTQIIRMIKEAAAKK